LGQKVHPIGFRLGIFRDWISKWYEDKENYAHHLHQDILIRKFLKEKFQRANISEVLIERAMSKIRITILAARPGIIIGRRGEIIEKTREQLSGMVGEGKIFLNVQEISQPDLDAQLVAERIAFQLVRRTGAKRAMREVISRARDSGAEGVKVMCKGRISGAEIARKEWMIEGRVPLHTLRANIDYGQTTAHTTYGCIGVKVWIYRGEILPGSVANSSKGELKDAIATPES